MSLFNTLLLTLSLSLALPAAAETLRIPIGQQGEEITTPTTGTTKAKVQEQYGEPQSQSGPVGDPAIYRWEYTDFVVYFENDWVIHSVIKFEPKVATGE